MASSKPEPLPVKSTVTDLTSGRPWRPNFSKTELEDIEAVAEAVREIGSNSPLRGPAQEKDADSFSKCTEQSERNQPRSIEAFRCREDILRLSRLVS